MKLVVKTKIGFFTAECVLNNKKISGMGSMCDKIVAFGFQFEPIRKAAAGILFQRSFGDNFSTARISCSIHQPTKFG